MIIKAIKETLGQVFHSPEATGSWEVECAIDEDVVECEEMDSPSFTGVPAPVVLTDDPWFGSAPTPTEKQKEYQQQEATQRLHDDIRRESETNESENIHQEMYELATKNGKTTTQLNPVGGSETFQEGPGGSMSGTGWNKAKG